MGDCHHSISSKDYCHLLHYHIFLVFTPRFISKRKWRAEKGARKTSRRKEEGEGGVEGEGREEVVGEEVGGRRRRKRRRSRRGRRRRSRKGRRRRSRSRRRRQEVL